MTTLGDMMRQVRAAFAAADLEDPAAEARIIVGAMTGCSRTDFIARADMILDPAHVAQVRDAIRRRIAGEPPYRILGRRSFYGLEFRLSKDTLEPRPDTEVLVDAVLKILRGREREALSILDLGTGTGAICQALLSELPNAHGLGVDLAEGAVATARENAALNGLADRFTVQRSHWFDQVTGQFDVIVSNPPYIESRVVATLDREVRDHDPHLALDGGQDGLDPYRLIAVGIRSYLRANGLVGVETGYDQRQAVAEIFAENGFVLVEAHRDLAGHDRAQIFRDGR